MSYLVFARKYRPGDFAAVKGQEQVTRTLVHAIERNKISHAFLFTGPRGVGKTSVSRILAKALNCRQGPTTEPCGECPNCLEVAKGNSLAVREIDGASHNGVDHVRDLIDSVRALPPPGYRYKIFIIDEVHMLSLPAFNALLKCLEEPPPHTIFILATTEVHKIPDTVISRCQRHDFRALPLKEVIAQLQHIASQEGFAAEEGALRTIARLSEGSMRDAQSLLDRVHAYCSGAITERETAEILGVVDRAALDGIARAIVARNPDQLLALLDGVFVRGIDPALFARDFAAFWHELLLLKMAGAARAEHLGVSEVELECLRPLVQGISERDLQDLAEIAREGAERALRSMQPRFALEALGIRMATREPVQNVSALLQAILSQGQGGGDGGVQSGGGSGSGPGGRAIPVAQSSRLQPAAVKSAALPSPPNGTGAAGPLPEQVRIRNDSETRDGHNGASVANGRLGPISSPVGRHATVDAKVDADRGEAEDDDESSAVGVLGADVEGVRTRFSWSGFVDFAERSAGKLLSDYLRRVAVEAQLPEGTRRTGSLKVTGGSFPISMLRRADNSARLKELLQDFSQGVMWEVALETVESVDGLAPGSLVYSQAQQVLAGKVKQREEIQSHPSVKVMTEVFPGTEIEIFQPKTGS